MKYELLILVLKYSVYYVYLCYPRIFGEKSTKENVKKKHKFILFRVANFTKSILLFSSSEF